MGYRRFFFRAKGLGHTALAHSHIKCRMGARREQKITMDKRGYCLFSSCCFLRDRPVYVPQSTRAIKAPCEKITRCVGCLGREGKVEGGPETRCLLSSPFWSGLKSTAEIGSWATQREYICALQRNRFITLCAVFKSSKQVAVFKSHTRK